MARSTTAYRRKREFDRTPEPTGREGVDNQAGSRFVVHEHHARRLHWDLRLEHDGALASWAIPNGIPSSPRANRKAIHVEDHPLEYIDFAGTIPEGNYGAGEVKIWDSGTYTTEKWRPREVIAVFEGSRLRGRYALFQAGPKESEWLIHRMDPPADPDAEPMPEIIKPMLARLSTLPADQSLWAFELKWDGVRAIARSQPGRFHLLTRTGKDVTATYPELRGLGRALGSHETLLDGEIVAFDKAGRPGFHALQGRIHLTNNAAIRRLAAVDPVSYLIFDLLWLDGHPLIDLPYTVRRERLSSLQLEGDRWHVPEYQIGDGDSLLAATREQGLEGLLAKRLDSPYTPGARGSGWLKIKNSLRQEFVIGGWREGKGARANRIGALELGFHQYPQSHESGRPSTAEAVPAGKPAKPGSRHSGGDPESRPPTGVRPRLRYCGRVGTGFTEEELDRLAGLLDPLSSERSPFDGRQPAKGARFVEPRLVCEVEFGEWTRDERLRHPSYRGLRDDRPAIEVVRERPQPPGEMDLTAAKRGNARSKAGAQARPGTAGKSAWRARSEAEAEFGAQAPSKSNDRAKASARATGRPEKPETACDAVKLTAAESLAALIGDGRRSRDGVEVEVAGRKLKLTNLDKILYPATGFTKGEMIGWYAAIAPVLLGHLRERPLTLKRYPSGVDGKHFFQKQSPGHRPSWVKTKAVWSEHGGRGGGGREVQYTICQDLPTLVWLANLATIELHPSLSMRRALARPAAVVFDLDPGPPADIVNCCDVALSLRDMFSELGLRSFAKTSGSKGMQIYVPLNRPRVSYEETKPFAHAVAKLLERRDPEHVLATMAKAKRTGKVFIDWSQNDQHKTTVAAYSLRARERPTVSTPISWKEVAACMRAKDPSLLVFQADEVLERVATHGDLFAGVIELTQALPRLDPDAS